MQAHVEDAQPSHEAIIAGKPEEATVDPSWRAVVATLDARMARHVWVSEPSWQDLYAPSSDARGAGAPRAAGAVM